jgi:signal transduction histidine kinase
VSTPFESKSAVAIPHIRVREPLRLRFTLLWCVLLFVFSSSFFLLRYLESFEYSDAVSRQKTAKEELLHQWLTLKGASLKQFSDDYSQWDEMVQFSREPDERWARDNIEVSLRNFQSCGAWVYRKDGTLVYSIEQGLPKDVHVPVLSAALLREQFQRERAEPFYLVSSGNLFELRVSHLRTSADNERTGEPLGWYVVARHWGAEQFRSLSVLTQSTASLELGAAPPVLTDEGERYQLAHPLGDARGGTVAWIRLQCGSQDIAGQLDHDWVQLLVFTSFVLITMGIIIACLTLWVIRPLELIGRSLTQADPLLLEGLEEDRGELGHVAHLVRQSFDHRRLLEAEVVARREAEAALRKSEAALLKSMEERAELARNLHDGVIQTLFAAGMGVGGALPLLSSNPDEARERLEKSRLMLNEVIRDMRSFLSGMEQQEPEGGMAGALARMAHHMQGIRSFTPVIEIQERAEDELSTEERAQLLYISREAMSNALRHGHASTIRFSLSLEPRGILFVVADDGRGLPEEGELQPGHGLANIRSRANELSAVLEILPAPDHGLVLRILIPIEPPP